MCLLLTFEPREIGRAVQQECRDRDLHSFPTRRCSDLVCPKWMTDEQWQALPESIIVREITYDVPIADFRTKRDRKSGSAGMPRPRSTLFPYTTLFRSGVSQMDDGRTVASAAREYYRARNHLRCAYC